MNKDERDMLVDEITSLLDYDELINLLPLDKMNVFLMAICLIEKYYDHMFTDKPTKEDIRLQNKVLLVLESLADFETEEDWLNDLSYGINKCMNIC